MPAALRRGRCRRARRVAATGPTSTAIQIDVAVTGEVIALHPEIEVALLRTAQRRSRTSRRHADATRAGLTLSYMGDVVTLDVRDDGVGFAVPERGRPAARRVRVRSDRDAPAGARVAARW